MIFVENKNKQKIEYNSIDYTLIFARRLKYNRFE